MKINQVVDLQNVYQAIKDYQMPIKTVYKFAMMTKKIENTVDFYNKEFNKILDQYAQKSEEGYVYTNDGKAIAIIDGKEKECAEKIEDLQNIDVDMGDISFSLDELGSLNLTLAQMTTLMPLIKE